MLIREVDKLINGAFDRIKMLQKNELAARDKFSFIGYLLSKEELSQKDVYIICLSLFGDGLNTVFLYVYIINCYYLHEILQTAPALIYNIYCLASNPEAQEKFRHEMKANSISAPVQKLSVTMLQNLPYLKACVKECFR